MNKYDVVIIGGGPAGLTAGLYVSRAGLKSLLFERGIFGGQIVNASQVDNYPGFPEGISGFELSSLMHEQAIKYGLETTNTAVTGIIPGSNYHVAADAENVEAEAVIIAAGSEYRKLGIPGEEEFIGRGVSYCATCDGFLFRGLNIAVIGGGDTAVSDALDLSEHASKVYLIHRRDQLRASQVLQQKVLAQPKIEPVWNTIAEEIVGDNKVKDLSLRNVKTGGSSKLQVSGVFVAIGFKPNSQVFGNIIDLDESGLIITDELMATSVPGIFAAGDIRRNSPRQVAAAVGDGATAALSAFKYIQGKSQVSA
jgi:thioredoxin reductase (NADPH)